MATDRRFGSLLDGLPAETAALARGLAEAVLEARPDLKTKVAAGWGALNFRHPKAGLVCGIFLRKDNVMLLFEHGAQLSDPDGVLEGATKQTRHMTFRPGDTLPKDRIGLYLMEAIALRV